MDVPLGLRVSFIFIFNRLVASFIFILEVCFVAACAYLLALWCDVAASMNRFTLSTRRINFNLLSERLKYFILTIPFLHITAPLRRRTRFVRHEKEWMRKKRMKMERRYTRLQEGVEQMKAYIKFKQENKPDHL